MSRGWQVDVERREREYLARNYQRQDSRHVVSGSLFFTLAVGIFIWAEIIIPGVRLVFNLWVKYGNQVLRAFQ